MFLPTFSNIHLNVFLFAAIFGMVGIPCMIAWVKLGDIIAQFWKSGNEHKAIGYVLSFLMLLCVVSVWL